MPGARQSPVTAPRNQSQVNPSWNQRNSSASTSDTSKWANTSGGTSDISKRFAKYTHSYPPSSSQAAKPPLPPRTQDLPNEIQDYNQYEPPLTAKNSTPWAAQETQVSQAQELLQPIAYNPVSPQVVTNHYQGSTFKSQALSQLKSEPQRNPPPKPPKLPQASQDELQQNVEASPQNALHSTQSSMHHHEPLIKQEQRQQRDFSEQPQQRAQPVTDRNTEATGSPEQHQDISAHINPQPLRHLNQPAVNNETGQSHATESKQENMLLPTVSHDLRNEHDDNDDIRWVLPLIEDFSGSNKALSPQLENSTLPYQHQQQVADALYSFPSAAASSTKFDSSAGASNKQAVRQSHDNSSRQQDIPTAISDKNNHQQSSSFHGNSSHLSNGLQKNESQPALLNTEPLHIAINPHEPQTLASTSTHQPNEESENSSPSITQPTAKSHNASALGFGGPSDWEHFGDRQAEEVDDTDLYSNRFCTITKATVDSTELPAEILPFSDLSQQEPSRLQEVEPAPSSGITPSQPSSRLPSHLPLQSTTVQTNPPTREIIKPVLQPQEKPCAARNSETEGSTDKGRVVPGHAVEIDMDETRRVWSRYPALSNDQVHPTSDTTSDSIENSSLRFPPGSAQNNIVSSEVSTPVPAKQLPRSDDSDPQWQSAEIKLEAIPLTKLIKTRIPSDFKTSVSTLQDTGNKPESADTKASTGGAEFQIPPESPTQQRQVADRPQQINISIRSENPVIYSTSKADAFKARSVEDKPGSRVIGTTSEILESAQRSNDSIQEQYSSTENFVNPKPELELSNTRVSSVSSKEQFLQDQSKDEKSKSNDSIHQRHSMEDLIASTGDSSASSTGKAVELQRIDEKSMPNDTIHRQYSKESQMTVNPDIRTSSVQVSIASPTGKGFEPQITREKPKSSDAIYLLNFIADEQRVNPDDALASSRMSSGPTDNVLQFKSAEHISKSDDSIPQLKFTEDRSKPGPKIGLHNEADHSGSDNHVLPTESKEDIPKKDDETSAVETSTNVSPLAQHEAEKPSGLVDETTDSVTLAMHEHSKEGPRQAADPEAGSAAPPKAIDTDNLYADLDPWGRASLNRYVTMLNEEAKAETDKEKLNVFMVFANRETRLRAVLYGADDGTAATQPVSERNPSKHLAETLAKRSEKALPALPPAGEPKNLPILDIYSENFSSSQGIQSVPKPRSSTLGENSRPGKPSGLNTTFGAESPMDDMQYSPGGRPIVARAQVNADNFKKPATELTLREKVSKVFTHVAGLSNSIPSPGSDAPMVVSSEASVSPEKLAYVPIEYKGHGEPPKYTSNRQSAYRPYAALKESLDSGSNIAIDSWAKKEGISDTSATTNFSEPFQDSSVKGNEQSPSDVPTSDGKGQKDIHLDLRRFERADFDPLISVLPSSGKVPKESVQLQDMKNTMDGVPDDFSFIHQSVVDWDTEAKKEREIHERERHVRQGESEQKIDALFDDHEIGYGDISELESEFKSSEAARKADEDRAEYQTFLSGVFDVVWTRLHFEIAQLTPLYDKCSRIVNETLVGKDMFEGSAKQLALAPTMNLLLALHQKLEIRHQKAFEAVLERDRRLKKTEVSPWYTLGNVAKVKQLEKQFDSNEKTATVDYYRQRNSRANKLMDVLDHNTLRGVGANQDYMEAIMKSIRRIASGRAFASMPSSESGLGVEEVMKAKSVTTIIASSSEQIVQTFHVADMLLNASDYDVSIANAKLANADAKVFAQLKEERSKEDQKLMGSLEHRLALIREDSRKTHDEIVKLLLFLGVQDGHAQSPPKGTSLPLSDPVRANKVLNTSEEAKWRQQ